MRGDAGFTKVSNELGGVISLVRPKRQLTGRSRGVAVNHVERGTPLGAAVCLGQIALHDQAAAVLHQRMAHEAQRSTGAGRLFVKLGVRVCGGGMRGIGELLALEVDLGVTVAGVRSKWGPVHFRHCPDIVEESGGYPKCPCFGNNAKRMSEGSRKGQQSYSQIVKIRFALEFFLLRVYQFCGFKNACDFCCAKC